MSIFVYLGGWFVLSCITAACWSVYRGRQKRLEIRRRAAFEAYEAERARHYHIVVPYQRNGAL